MSKFGTVLSGYTPILPLGKKISFMMMLDDYQKGDFFARRHCDHDKASKYIFISMRSYGQEIKKAIFEGVEEIFLVLDTPGNDFIDIGVFLDDLINYIRYSGFRGKIIYSVINEPLEHITVDEIYSLNALLSNHRDLGDNVYFAVGEMACDFRDYYKSFLNCNYKYDYISFHSDNSCSLTNLHKFLEIFPKGTKFINNEHYYYNGAKALGYNNTSIVNQFRTYTEYMLKDDRIKSIYVCMPFHAHKKGKYPWLGLNTVDIKTETVYETVAWKMLKSLDYKGGELMKLRELKLGDEGFDVRALQYCLNVYQSSNLVVDGILGKKTLESLKVYNGIKKITVIDVCSLSTWYELLQDINCEMYIADVLRILTVT